MAHWSDSGVTPDYRDEDDTFQPPDPHADYDPATEAALVRSVELGHGDGDNWLNRWEKKK